MFFHSLVLISEVNRTNKATLLNILGIVRPPYYMCYQHDLPL